MNDIKIHAYPIDWDKEFFVLHNGSLIEVKCTAVSVSGRGGLEYVRHTFTNSKAGIQFSVETCEFCDYSRSYEMHPPKVWHSEDDYIKEQSEGEDLDCWNELFKEVTINQLCFAALTAEGVEFAQVHREDVGVFYRSHVVFARYMMADGEVIPVVWQNERRSVHVTYADGQEHSRVSCDAFLDTNTYSNRKECLGDNMPRVILN